MPSIDVNPNSIYVHHHLGLGDHIICNGLVRYILKATNPDDLWLVVKQKNLNNVSRMFADDSRVKFIPVDEDRNFYELPLRWSDVRLVRVGFDQCRESDFDVSFYDSVGVSFEERWNSWYYQRDMRCEQNMIEELKLPDKFVLVHDTSSMGTFDLKINTDLPVIRVSRLNSETTIFDWIGIIERATEIHCIDSSFIHVVNSIDSTADSLFYHKIKASKMQICFRKNWSIVEY